MLRSRESRALAVAGAGLVALLAVARLAAAQGTLSALDTDVDRIAAAARPSVMTVFAQLTVVRPTNRGTGTVRRLHTRVGSGVAVADDIVLTTASVTLGAERVMVRTPNGIQVDGHLIGSDLVYNLAIVKVDGVKLPPMK